MYKRQSAIGVAMRPIMCVHVATVASRRRPCGGEWAIDACGDVGVARGTGIDNRESFAVRPTGEHLATALHCGCVEVGGVGCGHGKWGMPHRMVAWRMRLAASGKAMGPAKLRVESDERESIPTLQVVQMVECALN